MIKISNGRASPDPELFEYFGSFPEARDMPALFYSYSHKDEKFRNALAVQMSPLERTGVITTWYDRQISPGEKWEDEIDEHLEAADIILLLVSANFVASDYCWGKEVARALERHDAGEAVVIPIIVRPVDWRGLHFGRLQALPKDAKPVAVWANRDKAWVDVVAGIRKVAEALATGLPVARAPSGSSLMAEPTTPTPPKKPERHRADLQTSKPIASNLSRTIYDAKSSRELPGSIARSEGDPPGVDVTVNEAYDTLGICYEFFLRVFGRDSIDGKGMQLRATVHFGRAFNNVVWGHQQVVVGDGDGVLFNRFTSGVEVIAAKFSRGVIDSEAGFDYWKQSGALTESLSDVFGSLVKQYAFDQTVEQADWLIGQGLFAHNPKAALRSLKAPGTAYDDKVIGKDPQQAHMKGYVDIEGDDGGVHINSGIPNHAFCLVATALGGHAWEKAGRIWYEALRDRQLKPDAAFSDFARLTLANARRLYGEKSIEAQAVKYGWEMVGIIA